MAKARVKREKGPKIGSRVRVTSTDGKTELGFGTYMGTVLMKDTVKDLRPSKAPVPDLSEDDLEDALVSMLADMAIPDDARTPRIVLDSGATIYGFECWWAVEKGNKSKH